MRKNKGFTLIELLVVIAIIGILASIVLISLRNMTDRAKDTRIKSAMSQARTIAQLIYDDYPSEGYQYFCDPSTNGFSDDANLSADYANQLNTLEADIFKQQPSDEINCTSSVTDFCASARLIVGGKYFCIDDDGNALVTSTNPCSAANSTCQ